MTLSARKWLIITCLAGIACSGCIPMVTGGDVDLEIYLTNDMNNRLLWEDQQVNFPEAVRRAQRVSRAVVIPWYDSYKSGDRSFQPACVVTPAHRLVSYNWRIEIATFHLGHEFRFYPSNRRLYAAWVFVEGGWPVYIGERRPSYDQLTHRLWTKWDDYPVPWGLEAKGMVIGYPSSRPWDKYVAAGTGCERVRLSKEDIPNPPYAPLWGDIGNKNALEYAMSPIPCSFIKSVDDAKGKLTDEDRLLVFRNTLLLYELTKSYWDSDESTDYGTTRREAYEQNTRLLRERIDALETSMTDRRG